jgi:hypothetical protein
MARPFPYSRLVRRGALLRTDAAGRGADPVRARGEILGLLISMAKASLEKGTRAGFVAINKAIKARAAASA